jgi:hypothetical protein
LTWPAIDIGCLLAWAGWRSMGSRMQNEAAAFNQGRFQLS